MSMAVQLYSGWNFISLNVEAADMSLSGVFSPIPLSTGDHIKNQRVFADYYEDFGFFGGLSTLTTSEMYVLCFASRPPIAPRTITQQHLHSLHPRPVVGTLSRLQTA